MYPYPAIASLLKLLCTPAKYRSIVTSRPPHFTHNPEFWRIIPWYTYAKCPICGRKYNEPVNTYDIKHWGKKRLETRLYDISHAPMIEEPCNHMLGIHEFVNLQKVDPIETVHFENRYGEVPFVTGDFFDPIIKTYAILHALPICSVKNDQFVPTYTGFTLTYFSEDPRTIINRIYKSQEGLLEIDPDYYAVLVRGGIAPKSWYDLAQWAVDGLLGWLDLSDPEMPLRIGKGLSLPEFYRGIEGIRKPYNWWRNRALGKQYVF